MIKWTTGVRLVHERILRVEYVDEYVAGSTIIARKPERGKGIARPIEQPRFHSMMLSNYH